MRKNQITNFGAVKSLIIQYSSDVSKKAIVREFYELVKKSPILKKQFQIFYNLENKTNLTTESATRYIDANIGILKEYSNTILIKENSKLEKFVNEKCVPTDLQKDIHSLITETIKQIPNIDKLHSSFEIILESVTTKTEENSEVIELYETIIKDNDFDLFLETAMIKYKEKYSDFDELDNIIIETFTENNPLKIDETFNLIKENIIGTLKSKINESNDDTEKLKCYQSIDKLNLMDNNGLDLDKVIEINNFRKTITA